MKEIIFCERLKELRLENKYKQKDLALLLGVHNVTICDWEKGKCEPNLQALSHLAEIFEVPVGYLLGVED